MSRLDDVYRTSLTLLTDLYQLTMAQAYWSSGSANMEAVFHLYSCRHRAHIAVRVSADAVSDNAVPANFFAGMDERTA